MIALEKVGKTYKGEGQPTLQDISLALSERGLVFIVGPSGAGKSTFVSLLGGMDNDFSGQIIAYGQRLRSLSNEDLADYRLHNVGFSFQDGFLDEKNTVYEEVTKSLELTQRWSWRQRSQVKDFLRRLELASLLRRKIKSLSGGERKRVSLAKAMVKRPRLLILDEPTANLNAVLAEKTMLLIRESAQKSLVIVITHDLDTIVDTERVIALSDGRVIKDSNPFAPVAKVAEQTVKANKRRRLNLLGTTFKTFYRNFALVGPATMALALAITAAGMSLLLVREARAGLKSFAGRTLDSKAVVVEPKQNEHIKGKNRLLTDEQVKKAQAMAPECVSTCGSCFYRNVNDTFTAESGAKIFVADWMYPQGLGLNTLADSGCKDNYPAYDYNPRIEADLSFDEVALGLPNEVRLIFEEKAKSLGYDSLLTMVNQKKLQVKINASIEGVAERKQAQLNISSLYRAGKIEFMHTSPLFAAHFFEEKLQMEVSNDLDVLDPLPYTLKKGGVIHVWKDKIGKFFKLFQLSANFSENILLPAIEKPQSLTTTFFVSEKKKADVSALDGLAMFLDENNGVESYDISSSIYTFISGGMSEGFMTPLFVSSAKENLNRVADMNRVTDYDLRGYSLAKEDLPTDVLSSSLTDALQGQGLFFAAHNPGTGLFGEYPKTDREIAISSGLARQIYGGYKALGKNLHLLMLEKVSRNEDLFTNSFAEASLRISAIIDEEKPGLYHDPFFPLSFAIANTRIDPSSLVCTAFILHFKTMENLSKAVPRLRSTYQAYDFSAPMKEMAETIETTLGDIAKLLAIFAAVAVVLASFLLLLTLFLIIKRDEHKVGDLLALGYRPRQIRAFYIDYSCWIGLMAFLESFSGLFMAKRVVITSLSKSFPGYAATFDFLPYLLTFLISFVLSVSIGFLLSRKPAKLTPLRAFRR